MLDIQTPYQVIAAETCVFAFVCVRVGFTTYNERPTGEKALW